MGEQQATYQLNRTGLIYDPLMLEFQCEWDDQYPEKPDRVQKPYERCELYGLSQKCVSLPGRMATDAEIETCHTSRVNQLMKESEKMTHDELKHLSTQYDSMFWHQKSNNAARYALGSSIDLMDNIMTGKVDNGFAIIRPPGHHAMRDEPNGYCYFNNAAVVARTAIEKYNLKRVLILDWDVHHGQGTQFQFYDDPRVLYVSWHRYDHAAFWPNLRQSDFDYIGEKEGKGFNVNIPLNKTGFGNSEYLDSFFNLILPMAYEFDPELIIVSCGYDAAIGCFEGRMRITPACYAHFLNALSCFTNGKLCVLLEGGYCIKSLSEGVALAVRALLGYPCPRIEDNVKSDPIFAETMRNLISVLRPYWKSLQGLNDSDESITLKTYLENWDKQYREGVKYYSIENPPKEFALTGFYPLYSDAENQALDKEIDDLIQKTDLSVPTSRTHVSSDKQVDSESGLDGNFVDIASQIASKKITNGLAILKEKVELDKAAQFIRSRHPNVKKILTIQISSEPSKPPLDESSVNFALGSKSDVVTRGEINLNFGSEVNDAAYLTAFLRITMPVSYQFNPDLVIFLVDSAEMPISKLAFSHVLRLTQALANGNVLLLLRNKSADELKDQSISILKGEACPKFSKIVANDSDKQLIKDVIQKAKSYWSCLQYNDKLPKSDD